jgi:hypothetical protein
MPRVPKLRMIQLNCQRSRRVLFDLGNTMLENNISIALIQEPYTINGRLVILPTSFQVISFNGACKAAIVLNSSVMEIMEVSSLTTEYCACAWVNSAWGGFYLSSVYCQYGSSIHPFLDYIKKAVNLAANKPICLGLDANAVSSLWHSKCIRSDRAQDARNSDIEECIISCNLNVLNEPSQYYTFSTANGQSDIDLSLSNDAWNPCTTTWTIKPEWCISDHNCILIEKSFTRTAVSTKTPSWILKDADWIEHGRLLAEYSWEFGLDEFLVLSVDDKITVLGEWLLSANKRSLRKRFPHKKRSVPWWNNDLHESRRQLRISRRQLQRRRRTGDPGRIRAAERSCHEKLTKYKNELCQAKNLHWREFVFDKGNNEPWGDVYRICRGKRNNTSISSVRVEGSLTSTWTETAEALLGAFFPKGRSISNVIKDPSIKHSPECSYEEINAAFARIKMGKAAGLDGVYPEMARSAWKSIPDFVCALFNHCLRENYFPKEWKKSRVVSLLKAPNKDKREIGSYRPICLLSVFGKTLERILVNRLNLIIAPVLSISQYGFTESRSTEDAWHKVLDTVYHSVHRYVYGIFVDFKGAFDNLEWSEVLAKLRRTCPEDFGVWESYFNERKACIEAKDGSKVWRDVNRGCPQGSIGGPVIWNIMMDDLLTKLEGRKIKLVAYADDLLIILEANSRRDLEIIGTQAMADVEFWGSKVGVEVSIGKTVGMLLKAKKGFATNRNPNIRLGNGALKCVTEVKYLGITVGERLCFTAHLGELRNKIVMVMGQLSRVLRKDWGLKREAIRTLYRGLVLGCICYGASVWSSALALKRNISRLEGIQRVVLYKSLRVCRTVSTQAMQVIMGVPPIDLEIARRSALFRIRKGLELTESDLLNCSEVRGKSLSEIKTMLEGKVIEKWQTRWTSSLKGKTTREFISDVDFTNRNRWFNPGLNLTFLITGHGSFNAYLHPMGLAPDPGCLCGNALEDWQHVIRDCSIYNDLRSTYIGNPHSTLSLLNGQDVYKKFSKFADLVFTRRKQLISEAT